MENEEEKDRLTEIQDRMNRMEVGKRKRILAIFAMACAAIIIFRFVCAFGGCSHNEEISTEKEMMEKLNDEKQEVLEYSLERKHKMDSNVEQILDNLVQEDLKERAKKNGTK